jgi:xanthine dehydrogenase accessory factor
MPRVDESLPARIAQAILTASRDGPPLVSCSVIAAPEALGVAAAIGDKLLVFHDGATLGEIASGALAAAIRHEALAAIPRHAVETAAFTPAGDRIDGRRAIEAAGDVIEVLMEVVEPAATLLVVGGGHVGRSVGEIGALLGMSVVVLDDREDYANTDRFPFADQVICGDFASELDAFPINANTYIVLVSRGHKVDELSLARVVTRGPAYVGMIGSKRRTRTVLEHLATDGIRADALARVFTPIGLDIRAETPEEIALAVLAEIVLVRRGGSGRPLSPPGQALSGDI